MSKAQGNMSDRLQFKRNQREKGSEKEREGERVKQRDVGRHSARERIKLTNRSVILSSVRYKKGWLTSE